MTSGGPQGRRIPAVTTPFAAPVWLRQLGRTSWLLVGVGVLLFGLAWLLGQMSTIVGPILAGLVLATVAVPAVAWFHRHRIPRALGSLIVLLGFLALGVVVLLLVVGGIVAQMDSITEHANEAAAKAQDWLKSAGVDDGGATSATDTAKSGVSGSLSTLLTGVLDGIEGITSLAFGVVFTVFSIFFLLKDGPALRRYVDTHLGVPIETAHGITSRVVQSIRRYFVGVSIVAAFNAVVVGIGAYALGVPLAGTIAVVTAVTAYVPFIGAFVSGAFAVIIALGAEGTDTALIMLVIVLLANGTLQNIVQPIAFGATLDLNPLLILFVTIGFGALFGMIGLVLAAPLTSAAFHIADDLGAARAGTLLDATEEGPAIEARAAPGPA
jgi:putative heme transporter